MSADANREQPGQDVRSPGITGGCELPYVSNRHQT